MIDCPNCDAAGVVRKPGSDVDRKRVWEAAGFLEDAGGDCWARFGFAVLDLDGSQMQVRYRDDLGAEIRREVIE